MVRVRSVVLAAVATATLVSCGDPGTPSASDAGETAGSLTRVSAPPLSTPDGTAATASGGETTAPPGDLPTAETLARCSDIARITTDVLSDNAQGNIDPVFHGVLLTYVAEHADTFGGLWIDRDAFGTVVVAFTDDPATHRAELAQRRPTPDDIHAVEPPPEITDDRPIGEWGVAFDVVQVAHTEAELVDAIAPAIAATQTVTAATVSGGSDVLRNRVFVELSTPVSRSDLVAITDAISSDGISLEMICWSGQFIDEASEPIRPGTPLDVIRLPADDGTYPPDTRVTCDGLQFEIGDLDDLTPADDVEPGLGSVLDDWLANPEGQYWPQDGWVLLDADDHRSSFIHVGDDAVSFVSAEMGANGWIWAGAGGGAGCDVRLMLPAGVGEVEWTLDPGAPTPVPSSTEIQVLVTERGCASGQEMGERLLGPQVVETDDVVRIAFGVIPQPGSQDCPDNPSTPVVVELDAPLGDREIRDGTAIGPLTSLLAS